MDYQMKSHLSFIFSEEVKHLAGTRGVVIECSVKHSYVLYSMRTYIIQPVLYLSDTLASDLVISAADAECAGIETTSCRLQLYKRFVPTKERTFFRKSQGLIIIHYSRTIIMICSIIIRYPA